MIKMNIELGLEVEKIGKVHIEYLGSTNPHWAVEIIENNDLESKAQEVFDFVRRVNARLTYLPIYDPQFRKNHERIMLDAQREGIELSWDLGFTPEDNK